MRDEAHATEGKGNAANCKLILFVILTVLLTSLACGLKGARGRIPPEVETLIGTVSDDIAQERYGSISSHLDST